MDGYVNFTRIPRFLVAIPYPIRLSPPDPFSFSLSLSFHLSILPLSFSLSLFLSFSLSVPLFPTTPHVPSHTRRSHVKFTGSSSIHSHSRTREFIHKTWLSTYASTTYRLFDLRPTTLSACKHSRLLKKIDAASRSTSRQPSLTHDLILLKFLECGHIIPS